MQVVTAAFLAAALLIAAVIRTRQRLARLEVQLRRLRALATRDIQLRPLADGEMDLSALASHTDQLRGLGLTILGDAVEDSGPDGRHPTRWFVDADGTTFGWLGIARGVPVGFLMSCSPDRATLTRMIPRPLPSLAQPPFIDRQECYGADQLAAAIAAHRPRVPAGAAKVATLADAIREMRALRDRTIAWREAEAPGELLERDLRAMLGRHYERLGAVMARRLGITLPEARLRR